VNKTYYHYKEESYAPFNTQVLPGYHVFCQRKTGNREKKSMKKDASYLDEEQISTNSAKKLEIGGLPNVWVEKADKMQSQVRDKFLTKTYVVLNPVAGMTDAQLVRHRIEAAMQARDILYEIHETSGGEDLQKIIRSARECGFERFLAVGGDGTIAAVAGALTNSGYPVGIVPAGTANALARELHIPLDFNQAVDLALDSPDRRRIDAIRVGKTCYFLNISVGFVSQTMLHVARQDKRRFGLLAYIWKGLKQILVVRPQRFRLQVDGRRITCRASEVMVANAGILGLEQFDLDPAISLDDGYLDVCVVAARNLAEIQRFIFDILARRTQRNPRFSCFKAQHAITIETGRPLPVQADGEVVGLTPVEIDILPGAVQIIV
jgi:YegS/Rv2252/BmrU family lipid kinase